MLLSRICAPSASRSRCVTPLTAPCVPTGMNAGVSTSPCARRHDAAARAAVGVREPKAEGASAFMASAPVYNRATPCRSPRAVRDADRRRRARLGPTAAAPRATTRWVRAACGNTGRVPAIHAPAPVAAEGLTEGTRLAAIYDTILRARFDVARAELAQACPPAPTASVRRVCARSPCGGRSSRTSRAGCSTPGSSASAAAAIASARSWTAAGAAARRSVVLSRRCVCTARRSGACCAAQRLAAARDGKRIKDALERALELDRRLQDA